VAILGKGDYFGELALINHKPRAASVYASEYAVLVPASLTSGHQSRRADNGRRTTTLTLTAAQLPADQQPPVGDDVKLAFLDVKAFERLLGSCIERMEKNCAMYLSELAHQEGLQNV
jgi:cAMP-dependent protein kinase regulator